MTAPVFLDTVGILAVWDRADQWHKAATRSFGDLLQANRRLVTSSFVLIECANAAARTPFRTRVDALRRSFLDDGRLIDPSPTDLDDAWSAYSRGLAGQAGLVDHVSFLVMRRLGLSQAFTNDVHFRAAGFQTLF